MALDTLFPLPLGAFMMVLVPYLSVPNSKRSWYLVMWHVALGSQMPGTDNGIFFVVESHQLFLQDGQQHSKPRSPPGRCSFSHELCPDYSFGLELLFGVKASCSAADSACRALALVRRTTGLSTAHLCRATALHGHNLISLSPFLFIFIPGCLFATPLYDFPECFAIKCKTLGVCTQTRAIKTRFSDK